MSKITNIQIRWVDTLPRVNDQDAILATHAAHKNFQRDLKDFFPVFKEKYFLPRILQEPEL